MFWEQTELKKQCVNLVHLKRHLVSFHPKDLPGRITQDEFLASETENGKTRNTWLLALDRRPDCIITCLTQSKRGTWCLLLHEETSLPDEPEVKDIDKNFPLQSTCLKVLREILVFYCEYLHSQTLHPVEK